MLSANGFRSGASCFETPFGLAQGRLSTSGLALTPSTALRASLALSLREREGYWPDDGQLLVGRKVEVEGREQAAEGRRRLLDDRRQGVKAGRGAPLVVAVVRQHGETQQHVGGNRRAGRRGVVEELARARDQRLVVAARVEEALDALVPEEVDHLVRPSDGLAQVAPLEGGLIDGEQAVDEAGVVLEVAVEARDAVFPAAQQAAVRPDGAEEEVGVAHGRISIGLGVEGEGGLGEGAQHEAVPGGEHLLVPAGMDALLARRVELSPRLSAGRLQALGGRGACAPPERGGSK